MVVKADKWSLHSTRAAVQGTKVDLVQHSAGIKAAELSASIMAPFITFRCGMPSSTSLS